MMDHTADYIQYLRYQRRYSPHTVRSYKKDLEQFEEFLRKSCGEESLLAAHHHLVRAWVLELMEQEEARTSVKRKLSSLRSFYRYALRRDWVSSNPASLVQMPKAAKRLVQAVAEVDLERLWNEIPFPDDSWGRTQRLLLELFYQTGMRQAELIALRRSDVDLSGARLKVSGKGQKEREIPLAHGLQQHLAEYLEQSSAPADAPLLMTTKGKKLYPKLVYNTVNYYLSLVSGIEQKSPHVLRHSFATHMLDRGADLQSIKELLGHSSLAATQVYTHRSIAKLKSMYNQTHPKSR